MTNKSLKILILAATARSLINFRGDLILELLNSGFEVHCVAPDLDNEIALQLKSMGCMVFNVPLKRTNINPINDFKYFLTVLKICRAGNYSHVLSYTIKPVVYGMLASWFAGVKSRVSLITGLGFSFIPQPGFKARLSRAISRFMYRVGLHFSTAIIFQNPDDRATLIEQFAIPEEKTFRVFGSGINLALFPNKPLPVDPLCFLMIGRFLQSKGLHEYLEAARQIKLLNSNVIFLLVGWSDNNPASLSDTVINRYVQEGIIEILGKLEDVRPALARCHIYVLPSYREGTPRSTLEALATGRAIITTDAPGCRETVVEGENGFLVPIKSIEGLVHAMQRFIAEPSLIEKMATASRNLAENRFDVHKVNAEMLRIIRQA